VERFYWREIFKTYCVSVRHWLAEHGEQAKSIADFRFRFPNESRDLRRKARHVWLRKHRESPKYDMRQKTEAQFLEEVSVPIREIDAKYMQVLKGSQKVGKWIGRDGTPTRADVIAQEWYESQGYLVVRSMRERGFISTWVGTFLSEAIQSPHDPRVRTVYRGSTREWRTKRQSLGPIAIALPEDFGSAEYFLRRRDALNAALYQMRSAPDLPKLFDMLLEGSEALRDYLWVNEDRVVMAAREAITVLPREVVVDAVEWAIQNFWSRQPGWPDLLMYRGREYLFSEVKSPLDELSQEQMNWFRWAVEQAKLPCEICRVRKVTSPPSAEH